MVRVPSLHMFAVLLSMYLGSNLCTLEASPKDHVGCFTEDMVQQMGTGQVDMPIVLCLACRLHIPSPPCTAYCVHCKCGHTEYKGGGGVGVDAAEQSRGHECGMYVLVAAILLCSSCVWRLCWHEWGRGGLGEKTTSSTAQLIKMTDEQEVYDVLLHMQWLMVLWTAHVGRLDLMPAHKGAGRQKAEQLQICVHIYLL